MNIKFRLEPKLEQNLLESVEALKKELLENLDQKEAITLDELLFNKEKIDEFVA